MPDFLHTACPKSPSFGPFHCGNIYKHSVAMHPGVRSLSPLGLKNLEIIRVRAIPHVTGVGTPSEIFYDSCRDQSHGRMWCNGEFTG
jgi:hypothetical protein